MSAEIDRLKRVQAAADTSLKTQKKNLIPPPPKKKYIQLQSEMRLDDDNVSYLGARVCTWLFITGTLLTKFLGHCPGYSAPNEDLGA